MDNFEILKHYTIPSDVLMDMLSTYRLLGMNLEYEEKIKLTDKAPLKKLFDFLNIEVKTGKVEYHITSVY